MLMKWETQATIWFVLGVVWVVLSSYTTTGLWIALGCATAGLISLHMKEKELK